MKCSFSTSENARKDFRVILSCTNYFTNSVLNWNNVKKLPFCSQHFASLDCSFLVCCWIPAVLRLCCRYSIHFTFIMQRSGPSGFLCGWLHLVIFSIPAHLLFAWRSPPDSGLECFPSSLSDSAALGDCFPGSERHAARAGGSAYHTCCRIKGHSRRSGIMGGGKIIFFILFLLFLIILSDPPQPALPRHHLTTALTLRC